MKLKINDFLLSNIKIKLIFIWQIICMIDYFLCIKDVTCVVCLLNCTITNFEGFFKRMFVFLSPNLIKSPSYSLNLHVRQILRSKSQIIKKNDREKNIDFFAMNGRSSVNQTTSKWNMNPITSPYSWSQMAYYIMNYQLYIN